MAKNPAEMSEHELSVGRKLSRLEDDFVDTEKIEAEMRARGMEVPSLIVERDA